MNIHFSLNPKIEGITIQIEAKEYNEEVKKLMELLQNTEKGFDKIVVEQEEKFYFLEKGEIEKIYSQNGTVYVDTVQGTFESKERLYELEEKLNKNFVRISKSVLVNVEEIQSLEMEFNGKMKMNLKSGDVEYTSRSYLKDIKKALGL
ncbi:LytTR family DNA-binding domain-containing protein [Filifactor alocis]|uniref:LytTR family DNA-binding domain-containing protein n=1 Tax=Filifactor alocis TaxID=143361 RepID=UPI0023539542|nr:LytTR family DNA-binding domain-containing protein [Filifactor alocis]